MRVRIQVIIESEAMEVPVVQEVATLERGPLQPEGLGLTLAEAKDLLRGVQETMAAGQVAEFVAQQERCPGCGQVRSRKGRYEIVYRTLFGQLRLDSPRLYACPCQDAASRASTSPLAERLPKRTAPELTYLEAKFAAMMSYGLTVELLAKILPLGAEIWHGNVYRALRVVEDLEWDLEVPEEQSERAKKLKAVSEFHHYIEANRFSIPNYGDRYRHGEAITTSFAESTVNQVISRRMAKKQ